MGAKAAVETETAELTATVAAVEAIEAMLAKIGHHKGFSPAKVKAALLAAAPALTWHVKVDRTMGGEPIYVIEAWGGVLKLNDGNAHFMVYPRNRYDGPGFDAPETWADGVRRVIARHNARGRLAAIRTQRAALLYLDALVVEHDAFMARIAHNALLALGVTERDQVAHAIRKAYEAILP